MKVNNNLKKLAAIVAVMFCLTFAVAAQKKRPRTVNTQTIPKVVVSKMDPRSGAEKVSIQIKNSTKFLYAFGAIAKGIEDIDKSVRDRKASREVEDKNEQFKVDVIRSIRNLRAGLAALEVEFRTKPELKPYLLQIQGISDISGTAEDQALGGQFFESGKTLLFVVEKLSDTLAAMSSK